MIDMGLKMQRIVDGDEENGSDSDDDYTPPLIFKQAPGARTEL